MSAKTYTKDPACKREWRVEYYGPAWEEITFYCLDPLYSRDYVIREMADMRVRLKEDWQPLKGAFRQSSWERTHYAFPKSIRECLRIINHHRAWFDIVQFRLAHVEEQDNIIPYEILA